MGLGKDARKQLQSTVCLTLARYVNFTAGGCRGQQCSSVMLVVAAQLCKSLLQCRQQMQRPSPPALHPGLLRVLRCQLKPILCTLDATKL